MKVQWEVLAIVLSLAPTAVAQPALTIPPWLQPYLSSAENIGASVVFETPSVDGSPSALINGVYNLSTDVMTLSPGLLELNGQVNEDTVAHELYHAELDAKLEMGIGSVLFQDIIAKNGKSFTTFAPEMPHAYYRYLNVEELIAFSVNLRMLSDKILHPTDSWNEGRYRRALKAKLDAARRISSMLSDFVSQSFLDPENCVLRNDESPRGKTVLYILSQTDHAYHRQFISEAPIVEALRKGTIRGSRLNAFLCEYRNLKREALKTLILEVGSIYQSPDTSTRVLRITEEDLARFQSVSTVTTAIETSLSSEISALFQRFSGQ